MANGFSNHYNSSGSIEPGVGTFTEAMGRDAGQLIGAGWSHSRMRRSHARMGIGSDVAVGEEVRILTLKSSDRLYSLLVSQDGGATACDGDLGIYLSGAANDGALPAAACVDAFSSTAIVLDTAANRVEHFELGDYDTENMGLQMWELVNITAAATYASNPFVNFDLTWTMTVEATVGASLVQVEAFYTAGD